MNGKFKLRLIVIAIVILGVLGFVLKNYFQYRNYTLVRPIQGEIFEAVYGLGKVKSNHRYDVKLGVMATVSKVFVKEGEVVSKGQKLIEFDSSTVIKAPFAGTITLVSFQEGETATSQLVAVRLEDLNDRYIEISLEQEAALRLKKGQNARISFESLRGEVLQGKVISVFPKENEFLAILEVPHLQNNILPGMTADISVEIGKITGTLVPLKSLRSGFLLVRRGQKTEKIKAEVGLIDGLSAEIKNIQFDDQDEILVSKD